MSQLRSKVPIQIAFQHRGTPEILPRFNQSRITDPPYQRTWPRLTKVDRYLEGHVFNTSIQLDGRQALFGNAMASLRCLHEALQHFGDNASKTAKELQVASGVWGFLPYVTEYWCVMMREIALLPEDEWDSRFSSMAMAVSTTLQALRAGSTGEQLPGPIHQDLEPLKKFRALWHDAIVGFQARAAGRSRGASLNEGEREMSTRNLPDQTLICFTASPHLTPLPKHIHDLFPQYESIVQKLVATYEHAELTRKELDEFRESFGHHAYICRFSSCSRGWSGLTNHQQRLSHEATHSVIFPCPELLCQYPPFGSRAALKRHHSEVHDKSRPKPRLRRSGPVAPRKPLQLPRPQSMSLGDDLGDLVAQKQFEELYPQLREETQQNAEAKTKLDQGAQQQTRLSAEYLARQARRRDLSLYQKAPPPVPRHMWTEQQLQQQRLKQLLQQQKQKQQQTTSSAFTNGFISPAQNPPQQQFYASCHGNQTEHETRLAQ